MEGEMMFHVSTCKILEMLVQWQQEMLVMVEIAKMHLNETKIGEQVDLRNMMIPKEKSLS